MGDVLTMTAQFTRILLRPLQWSQKGRLAGLSATNPAEADPQMQESTIGRTQGSGCEEMNLPFTLISGLKVQVVA